MGSLAKHLGQLAAKSFETESAAILRQGRANKLIGSLAHKLDGTLREGHHDMRVFGLGTAAAWASRERYAAFTTAMLHVYRAMEEELESTHRAGSAVEVVWGRHRTVLRRASRLESDLLDVVDCVPVASPATEQYVRTIRDAGEHDRAEGGARLLGHLYCRYFADLFGGQMLGDPTRIALGLPSGTPRHYTFDFGEGKHARKDFIEDVYQSLNDAGEILGNESAVEEVVEECRVAFRQNVQVYSEEPKMTVAAVRGVSNVAYGFLTGRR